MRKGSCVGEKSGAEVVLDFLFWRENVAQWRDLVAPCRPVVVVAVGVGFGVDADVDSIVAAELRKIEVVERKWGKVWKSEKTEKNVVRPFLIKKSFLKIGQHFLSTEKPECSREMHSTDQ